MNWTRRHMLQLAGGSLLAACAPAIGRRDEADAIIIGAGLSGLNAARMLAADGMNVIVLEAASRVGGRVMTLDTVPGRPEGGGQAVGQSYARIRATASDLGIGVGPYPVRNRSAAMAVDGRVFDVSDWGTAPENPFPQALKPYTPSSALLLAASRDNPFADTYAWRDVSPQRDISAEAFLEALGLDARARALVDHTLNGNSLSTYSMANVWRALMLYAEDSALGPSDRIAGGSSRLTEAMAASLPGRAVRLATPVRALADMGSHVEVTTDTGILRAPFVICSAPFAAMRGRMAITGPAADSAAAVRGAAIQGLPYTYIHQIHVIPDNRFWETDGLPVEMWTDGPLERIFANYDEAGEVVSLTCWVNGDGVNDALTDEQLFELAAVELLKLRGAKVRGVQVVRWDARQPWSGGAYMYWAPGQIGQWAATMGAPAGRIHFAGEHLAFLHAGMEGAMESGELAALAVMEAASGAVQPG